MIETLKILNRRIEIEGFVVCIGRVLVQIAPRRHFPLLLSLLLAQHFKLKKSCPNAKYPPNIQTFFLKKKELVRQSNFEFAYEKIIDRKS